MKLTNQQIITKTRIRLKGEVDDRTDAGLTVTVFWKVWDQVYDLALAKTKVPLATQIWRQTLEWAGVLKSFTRILIEFETLHLYH